MNSFQIMERRSFIVQLKIMMLKVVKNKIKPLVDDL